jgi:hypothetical protein
VNLSQFRDELQKELNEFEGRLTFEAIETRDPDDLDVEIYDITGEWTYQFAGPSWVAIMAAVRAAKANGDFEDPREKYPEYY